MNLLGLFASNEQSESQFAAILFALWAGFSPLGPTESLKQSSFPINFVNKFFCF